MSDKKECFIIMPITTPELMIEKYRDGEEHFRHVLDCLFIPAIDKAGYIPIPPKAEGSDLIQAEIIKNLETAEIILCDMSSLNPNVFFEFGIRTSLNKPVCIVKDELTKIVPFDTGILNHQEYKSSLEPWELETEIKKLSDHLVKSSERSKGVNTLWKYFGFKSEAEPYKVAEGAEGKLEYISLQMDSLREKVDKLTAPSVKPEHIWHSDYESEINALKVLKLTMEGLIRNDNKHNRESAARIESRLRDKAHDLLSNFALPETNRNEILEMFEDIHELKKAHYLQKGPEENGHLD